MEKEGRVSLWLGSFNNQDDFTEFMDIKYNLDGDSTPSEFEKVFNIEYYDEDFSEIYHTENETSSLKNLLDGCSYDYQLIDSFNKNYKDSVYNAVVLLYDFEYGMNEVIYQEQNNVLTFIGCVDYNK